MSAIFWWRLQKLLFSTLNWTACVTSTTRMSSYTATVCIKCWEADNETGRFSSSFPYAAFTDRYLVRVFGEEWRTGCGHQNSTLGILVWKYTPAAELECICWKRDIVGKTEKDYQLWTSWSNADDAFYVEYRLFFRAWSCIHFCHITLILIDSMGN